MKKEELTKYRITFDGTDQRDAIFEKLKRLGYTISCAAHYQSSKHISLFAGVGPEWTDHCNVGSTFPSISYWDFMCMSFDEVTQGKVIQKETLTKYRIFFDSLYEKNSLSEKLRELGFTVTPTNKFRTKGWLSTWDLGECHTFTDFDDEAEGHTTSKLCLSYSHFKELFGEPRTIEITIPEGHTYKQCEEGNTIKIDFIPEKKEKQLFDYANEYYLKMGWIVRKGVEPKTFKGNLMAPSGEFCRFRDNSNFLEYLAGISFADCCGILKHICDDLNESATDRGTRYWIRMDCDKYIGYGLSKSFNFGAFFTYSQPSANEVISLCGTQFLDRIFKA